MAKFPLQAMGAHAAEVEAKKQAEHNRKHAKGPDLSDQACVDCGVLGSHGDGKYFYCKEHLPDDFYEARDAAAQFKQDNPDEYRRLRVEHARRVGRAIGGYA